MNNRILSRLAVSASFVLSALCYTSCKEKGVIVNMGGGTPVGSDTTYVTTVPTPQERVVLIEEFTGVSCPPCPKGHTALASIKSTYGEKVAIMGIQVFGFIQGYPVIDHATDDTLTKHDNRTQVGTDLSNEVYGKINQMPLAGVDRVEENSSLYLARDVWSTHVATRVTEPTKANVNITSSYAAGKATIKVQVIYTAAVSLKQKLTLALIENSVIDAQLKDLTIVEDYEHEEVLRDILTNASGSPILSTYTAIEPGRVYERTFTYDFDAHPLFNVDNCKWIAFVSNADAADKSVLQAHEVSVK